METTFEPATRKKSYFLSRRDVEQALSDFILKQTCDHIAGEAVIRFTEQGAVVIVKPFSIVEDDYFIGL